MTEYRIAEQNGEIWIEESKNGKNWHTVQIHNVPRYHATLADARSWVATIKRGVVYHDAEAPPLSESDLQWECARDFRIFRNHDAEDAPNLAQDERKAEELTWYSVMPSNGKIDIEMSEVVAVFKDEYEAVAYGKKRYGSVFWVLPHHDPR